MTFSAWISTDYRSVAGPAVTMFGAADRVEQLARDWELESCAASAGEPQALLRVGIPVSRVSAEQTPTCSGPLATVLDAADVETLQSLGRQSAIEILQALAEDGHVVVREREAFRVLVQLAVRRASKFHLVNDSANGDWLVAWLTFADVEAERMIVNRRIPHGPESDCFVPGLLIARDRIEDISSVERNLTYWLPAPVEKRDSDGTVEARQLAWHLTMGSAETSTGFVVLDRADTAVYIARSSVLELEVALVVTAAWEEPLNGLTASEHKGMVRTLTESGRVALIGRSEFLDIARGRLGAFKSTAPVDIDSAPGLARLPYLPRRFRPVAALEASRTLLIAGHDFKFLGEVSEILRSVTELRVVYDKWPRQNQNSVAQSEALLNDADIVLCEFSSHNAVWYSWHKRPGQRLVVRFHGYELFQDFVRDINIANVDVFVFVSEFYRGRVIQELGWPRHRTVVVPNTIDALELDQAKHPDARFHLGIAGIVPILKRPDRALDLLEQLIDVDDRYVLHIRGRSPWDYGWMWKESVARDAYMAFYERLTERPELLGHLAFDEFGADMAQWFRRIGWMLSPSSRETFHLAPVEGMSSGAIPVVWDRDGAHEIFGARWVHSSTEDAVRAILENNRSCERFEEAAQQAKDFAGRYDMTMVGPQWAEVLFGPVQETPTVDERFDRESLTKRFEELGTAAALDRLVIALLEQRDGVQSVQLLRKQHPGEFNDMSERTRRLAESLRIQQSLEQGLMLRPPRTPGAAYLPRYGTAYAISADLIEETAEGSGEVESETRVVGLPAAEGPEAMITLGHDTPVLDAIQLVADAVTRRARVHRPQILATEAKDPAVTWGVLIGARRLGVPVIRVQGPLRSLAPATEEFDGTVRSLSEISPAVVRGVQSRYDAEASTAPSISLNQITVGIISDEFTERTVSERCAVVHIPRKDAYLTVASQSIDVLFVESAWSGRDGEWFHGVAYYKDSRRDLEEAVRVARAKGIPVVFWNKEDPVHFKSFAPTAALCDVVFTTDADCIPAYLSNVPEGSDAAVGSMPFFAEPKLHHPLPGAWEEKPTVSYAGTYYGQRYADRSAELDRILAAALPHGLTIYDRQRNLSNSPYSFPDRYDDVIAGGLSYDDVLEAYKAHPVHINVNSVNDSPTMFSRRVVEIAASGSVVVSGRGRGISECLSAVPVSDNAHELGAIMGACLGSKSAWRSRAWAQLRAIRRSYLTDHALGIMLRAAGLPIGLEPAVPWTASVSHLDASVADDLLSQTVRPRAVRVVGLASENAVAALKHAGIVLGESVETEWSVQWEVGMPSTWAEDLLHAARFVPEDVNRIGARIAGPGEHGLMVWQEPDLPVVFCRQTHGPSRPVSWLMDQDASTGRITPS